MRRSRGALSGFLLVLLGLWGTLVPFVGPYFHYAYTPDTAWTYTTARLWLEILPGAAVFLGGIVLIVAAGRHTALSGALLAAAAGAWFALGTTLSPLWNHHVVMGGSPASPAVYMRIMEQLGFFFALGVVIVFIAAAALGRIASVPSGIKTAQGVPPARAETVEPAETVPAGTVPDGSVPAGTATTGDTTAGTARTEDTTARAGGPHTVT
ncbi:MAG: hypothetical protein JO345_24865 [Streptosporangiaceae bacterium]|nr:hypothetical protein [Streptosporangiaceae bacterium]